MQRRDNQGGRLLMRTPTRPRLPDGACVFISDARIAARADVPQRRCRHGTIGIRSSTRPCAYCLLGFETLNKYDFRNTATSTEGTSPDARSTTVWRKTPHLAMLRFNNPHACKACSNHSFSSHLLRIPSKTRNGQRPNLWFHEAVESLPKPRIKALIRQNLTRINPLTA